MAEASRDSADHMQRLPENCELTTLQKDIYELLLKGKPQKALAIAKALGKTSTRDVNPDLYKMLGWDLLCCNEEKLWSIKAKSRASENKAKMEQPNRTGSDTTSPLTEQQREILTILENNKPMKAMEITKRLGKSRAKDVNPDLYTLKTMDLLTHSKEENLWTVKSQNNTRCKERNEDSHMVIHPQVVKWYNINIQNSQNFTVGDKLVNVEYSQDRGYITGDSAALPDALGAQDAVQGAEFANSSQSEDSLPNVSDLSVAEEIQERSPRTSSPANPDQSQQCLNVSAICDVIEQLKLEKQDEHLL